LRRLRTSLGAKKTPSEPTVVSPERCRPSSDRPAAVCAERDMRRRRARRYRRPGRNRLRRARRHPKPGRNRRRRARRHPKPGRNRRRRARRHPKPGCNRLSSSCWVMRGFGSRRSKPGEASRSHELQCMSPERPAPVLPRLRYDARHRPKSSRGFRS
jgi:hypothetical protein